MTQRAKQVLGRDNLRLLKIHDVSQRGRRIVFFAIDKRLRRMSQNFLQLRGFRLLELAEEQAADRLLRLVPSLLELSAIELIDLDRVFPTGLSSTATTCRLRRSEDAWR